MRPVDLRFFSEGRPAVRRAMGGGGLDVEWKPLLPQSRDDSLDHDPRGLVTSFDVSGGKWSVVAKRRASRQLQQRALWRWRLSDADHERVTNSELSTTLFFRLRDVDRPGPSTDGPQVGVGLCEGDFDAPTGRTFGFSQRTGFNQTRAMIARDGANELASSGIPPWTSDGLIAIAAASLDASLSGDRYFWGTVVSDAPDTSATLAIENDALRAHGLMTGTDTTVALSVGFFQGALDNEDEVTLGFIPEYAIVPGPF